MTLPELKHGGKERRKSWRSEDNLQLALGPSRGTDGIPGGSSRLRHQDRHGGEGRGRAPEVEQADVRAQPSVQRSWGAGVEKAGRLRTM